MLLRCLITPRGDRDITGSVDGVEFVVKNHAVDVPDAVAQKLIATGNFEPLQDEPVLEAVPEEVSTEVPVVKRGRKAKQA